jgi:hypothetical protein
MQAYMAYLLGSIFYEVNFRYWEFCEGRLGGVLRSSVVERPITTNATPTTAAMRASTT